MKLIRLINYIKVKVYRNTTFNGPFVSDEEDYATLYARYKKGFHPSIEEVQKYDKYQLAMRFWELRRLVGGGPITTRIRLSKEARRYRQFYKPKVLKKKVYKRRFLKAYACCDVQTLLSIFGASRNDFKRIIAGINGFCVKNYVVLGTFMLRKFDLVASHLLIVNYVELLTDKAP
jgi:hypothetical protein